MSLEMPSLEMPPSEKQKDYEGLIAQLAPLLASEIPETQGEWHEILKEGLKKSGLKADVKSLLDLFKIQNGLKGGVTNGGYRLNILKGEATTLLKKIERLQKTKNIPTVH